MRTTIYEGPQSTFDSLGLSMMVRLGVLISEEIFWGGHSISVYNLIDNCQNMSPERKLLMLSMWQDEDMQKIGKDLGKQYKIIKKVKHLDKEGLRIKIMLEKLIGEYFQIGIDSITNIFYKHNFPIFNGPLFTSEVMDFYYLRPLNSEAEGDGFTSMSKLLLHGKHAFSDESIPDIPFLPLEFMNMDWNNSEIKTFLPSQPEALNPNNFWLHKCFTIPNFLFHTETEILLLRSHTQAEAKPFREAIDEWSKRCIKEQNTQVRISYFEEHVLPKAYSFQSAINNHEIVLKRANNIENIQITILIGEVPLSVLINFYNHFNALPPETFKVLEEYLKNNPQMNSRRPVIVLDAKELCNNLEEVIEADKSAKENSIIGSKKSISVDD